MVAAKTKDLAGPGISNYDDWVTETKYGRQDCPYGWVCVAEQHAHDLSPLALIDVYSLPEEEEEEKELKP